MVFAFVLITGVGTNLYLRSIDHEEIAIDHLRNRGALVFPELSVRGEFDTHEVIFDEHWIGSDEDFAMLRHVNVQSIIFEGQQFTNKHVRIIATISTLAGIDLRKAEVSDADLQQLRQDFDGIVWDAQSCFRRQERRMIFTQEQLDAIYEEWKATEEPPEVGPEPFCTHGGVI